LVGAQQILVTLFPTIGPISLGITYSTFAASCIVAPAVVRAIGLKASIAVQLLCITLWLMTSLRPSLSLAVPASLLIGFFAASFWTAVPTYIATISGRYDQLAALEADLGQTSATGSLSQVGDSLLETSKAPPGIISNLAATFKLTVSDTRLALLVPLFCYQGTEQVRRIVRAACIHLSLSVCAW
jgi:hypothetical protein